MSENLELQNEEREALLSIYEGDNAFKEINPSTFQYRFGDLDIAKSFLLELSWSPDYPNELPVVNMDTFYNKHLSLPLKKKIIALVLQEAEQYLGMSMTYSVFEFIKEKYEELLAEEPETIALERLEIDDNSTTETQKNETKKEKKEQLTKAQKRRQWNRATEGSKGEKPRGWNWTDIVKHLSQLGTKDQRDAPLS